MSEEPNNKLRATAQKASMYVQRLISRLPRWNVRQSPSSPSSRPRWDVRQSFANLPRGDARQWLATVPRRSAGQYQEFANALRFLTVLPLPVARRLPGPLNEESPIIGSGYFPLVGLILGLLLWLLIFIFSRFLPVLALAALLVVADVLLTGGLHLDGLMDTCDGLFGGVTRERKLEIMRDSRVGSFGILGAACILLLKFAFFVSLGPALLPLALLVTFSSARWGMVLAVRVFPSARLTGLGSAFRQTITLARLLLAAITSLIIAVLAAHLAGLFVWIVASLAAVIIGAWITRSLGGLTGDTYGAIEEVTEVIALLLLVLLHAWL